MNKQLFSKITIISGLFISALSAGVSDDPSVMWMFIILLTASSYIAGSETGEKTDWELKSWWKYVVLGLNAFFVLMFCIGFIQGVIGM